VTKQLQEFLDHYRQVVIIARTALNRSPGEIQDARAMTYEELIIDAVLFATTRHSDLVAAQRTTN